MAPKGMPESGDFAADRPGSPMLTPPGLFAPISPVPALARTLARSMILTLSARCLRSMLLPAGRSKKSQLDMLDLPRFTRETLGLSGVNLSTDLLVGADRARLESIRERAASRNVTTSTSR